MVGLPYLQSANVQAITYSTFVSDVEAHKISTVTISSDGTVAGTLKSGGDFTTAIPIALNDQTLLSKLESARVTVTAVVAGQGSFWSIVVNWLFILVPVLLIWWIWRRASRQSGQATGIFGMGRSRAKVFTPSDAKTTFADVAGYEGVKAEVSEIIDFLRNPDRYAKLGAAAPRGELLIGPPGTGKTLLARAVAGEANVSFFFVDGSSFVEMFVGVGASRVRDLFTTVKRSAPAILFIDEIDAIGQRRSGVREFASNDEREQTLNQLLAEMDGFSGSTGIIVLAATNRPEVLDHALLRPGRFDRRIVVPLPNVSDRTAILAVHCSNKPLDPGLDLDAIARKTPGFSGADLANLSNEAAIEAVRAGRTVITAEDFDAARDRIILGRREGSNVLLPEEKQRVAVHESGHALVAALSEHADPVERITILPAGETLGATEQLPLVERRLQNESALHDVLATQLGGRAAELAVYGEGSTGASNDLAAATTLATRMVREFGFSTKLGPVGYPAGEDVSMSGSTFNRPYAEATQRIVDSEVARLLREGERRALDLITAHRRVLDALCSRLIETEALDGRVVYELLGAPVPSREPPQEAATIKASGEPDS